METNKQSLLHGLSHLSLELSLADQTEITLIKNNQPVVTLYKLSVKSTF